jgi:hypothetical protein
MTAFLFALLLAGGGTEVVPSRYIRHDFELTTDPASKPWRIASRVFAENGPKGEAVPGHLTEIRSRWSDGNLYFLFICPYEELYLKENPSTTAETNHLWDWDVAEVFVGGDFEHIRHYREFQVSPQGEWVDLDINWEAPASETEKRWLWNSGMQVMARIDKDKKIWYGEIKIPFQAIVDHYVDVGTELRVNFYRIQGPPANRKFIAWQPTHSSSYHVPEAFGLLRLVK